MKNKVSLLFAILFLSIQSLSSWQTYGQQTVEFFKSGEVTIQSKVLKEDRTVAIHLPQQYNFTNQSFPVLYILDGRTHIKHAQGAVDFLTDLQLIPDQIVVAIYNVDRTRDFSPVHEKRFPTSGGADKFLGFLSKELKPYIEEKYRASNFSTIMGHSFGGTFITYALLEQPELFDGYIGISPYLHYADNYLVNKAATKLHSGYKHVKQYYMSVGKEPDYFAPLEKFSAEIKEKAGNEINFRYEIMEEENHGTIPYVSLYNGLRFVFSDWQFPRNELNKGLAGVDNYYKELSRKYGYKIIAPELVINMLGYVHLQNNEVEKAIAVFEANVKRYVNSPNVYDSLGEAYEKDNQLKEARKCYKKAYDIGKELGDRNAEIYLKNWNRVKDKLK